MEHELEPGVGGQMYPIIFELRSREAWKQVQLIVGRQNLGELLQNLRQSLTIPQGRKPVHRWADEKDSFSVDGSEKQIAELGQHGLNAERHRRGALRGRQEVGQARDDADGRLGTNLGQDISEDLKPTAMQELGRGDSRTGTGVDQREVALHVRVPDHGETPGLSHDEARKKVNTTRFLI